jgi:ubiquinone/menaquinone biosynthesis C-methylase UbiE
LHPELLLLLTPLALAQVQHQNHPPRDSAEYARVLEDPSRDAWQKPHTVVSALALQPAETIADIGAGTGYFSRRFARHAGMVFAVDIDQKLLDIAAKDAPPSHSTILATPDDPRLSPASVDTIFFCDVLHHISGRPAYYRKIRAALKPGGRLVVIDFFKKPLPVGPSPAMKLSEDEVQSELSAAGFRLAKSFDFLPHQYFLVFRPE